MLSWFAQTAVAIYARVVVTLQSSMTKKHKKSIVYDLIGEIIDDSVVIDDGMILQDDLDLDVLDRIYILMALEEKIGHELPDLLVSPEMTVGDLIQAISR